MFVPPSSVLYEFTAFEKNLSLSYAIADLLQFTEVQLSPMNHMYVTRLSIENISPRTGCLPTRTGQL